MHTVEWEKKGLIFCPSGEGFFKTHAARPVVWKQSDGSLRIFYSSRDSDDRMLPAMLDVDGTNPSRVLRVHDNALAGLGSPGTFDDSGVTLGSAIEHDGELLFYYTGWKRRRVVSFELLIGLMRWDPATESLHRVYEGPLIGQDRHHPLLTAGPFVVKDAGRFKMWYCSGTDWQFPEGNPEPIYTVFYAESDDGLTWIPHGEPVIPYQFDDEVISAPWVVKTPTGYSMWYSKRGCVDKADKNYRIGYAESADGISWRRLDDQAGITVSPSGWDSEMVCYPAVINHEGNTYMFYSGNGVGRGGLGYAVSDRQLEIVEW